MIVYVLLNVFWGPNMKADASKLALAFSLLWTLQSVIDN